MRPIRRRILGVVAAVVTVPFVQAQQRPMRRIGLLWLGSAETSNLRQELVDGLRNQGFVEGSNVAIEDRSSVSRYEELDDLARRLVDSKPDVIVTYGATATRAVRKATSAIPIVIITGGDPVQMGLVESLSHPGANVTGLTMMGTELSAKRLQLLKEVVPRIRKVAIMFNPSSPVEFNALRVADQAAQSMGLQTYAAEVRVPDDLETRFSDMSRAGVDALLVVGSTMLFANRQRISDLAKLHKLPMVSNYSQYADAGALLAYGPDVEFTFRQASIYVAKILKGASAANLPVEQSSKLTLAVNLKTAQALNLTIPQAVLLRADHVIR